MNSEIPIINPANQTLLHLNGNGYVDAQGNPFPVVNNVLRFVPNDNYTANFGFQWNKFQKTQIDQGKPQFRTKQGALFCRNRLG